ncbi:bifunctional oligoribonuclease/PAP phosphatase NrnA [Candidatus Kapaibacterium sp.]
MLNYINKNDIYKIVSSSKNVVISTHTNPDGDAVGSEIALFSLLKKLGKSVTILNDSPTPDNLKFIDPENAIRKYDSTDIQYILSADLIIIADLNDPKRLKSLQEPIQNSKARKLVIDHHIEPQKFADYYYINTDETSTGQMVFDIFKLFDNIEFDVTDSTALYSAIMTDTGSFRFPRTIPKTHHTIAELIQNGADPVSIYENIYNSNSLAATLILGEALSNIRLYLGGKLSIMMITDEMFRRTKAKNEDIDNFVEKTLSISGVALGVLIANVSGKNEIRCSFRSKGNISARDLAVQFGGGGHFHAAGARLFDMSLDDAKSKIVEAASGLLS